MRHDLFLAHFFERARFVPLSSTMRFQSNQKGGETDVQEQNGTENLYSRQHRDVQAASQERRLAAENRLSQAHPGIPERLNGYAGIAYPAGILILPHPLKKGHAVVSEHAVIVTALENGEKSRLAFSGCFADHPPDVCVV